MKHKFFISLFMVTALFLSFTSYAKAQCVLDEKFQQVNLNEGFTYYTDRSYTLTSVPEQYVGMDMIKTPNNDKFLSYPSDYLTFVISVDSMVYVAFDRRATSLPDWLNSFNYTGADIQTSDGAMKYLKVYSRLYLADECVNLGANRAPPFSSWTNGFCNYIVFYAPYTSECVLDPRFEEAKLDQGINYYTDRSYTLTSVPKQYVDMNMIVTPNDDKYRTDPSHYLKFVMPFDGMVYVAFDRRATSLPDWLSGFTYTGDDIQTSDSEMEYLKVFKRPYSAEECVNLGANRAPPFSSWESGCCNYIVFYGCPTLPPPAPIAKTGQIISYAPWDDGAHQKGIPWPDKRFTDNGDGTVTDHLTGLIWLKDADCAGEMNWEDALTFCSNLATDSCGLTDGSSAGDWRLPNVEELQSLIHYGFYRPPLPNTEGTGKWTEGDPFTGVESSIYWTSSTGADYPPYAWFVDFNYGKINGDDKANFNYVWCVRDGEN